jgi:hypothetical protein
LSAIANITISNFAVTNITIEASPTFLHTTKD